MTDIAHVALLLVALTGPTGQRIDVNPAEVTSVRDPTDVGKTYVARGVHCMLGITNGRFIAVRETCDAVRRRLHGTMSR
jgi:hypothetical protein